MAYSELGPPPVLAPWLACMWERETDDGPAVRVLPDGCIDIVWIDGVGTHVVGPNTTAFAVSLPPGTRVVGARLRPGAAPSLLGVAAQPLRDARVPIDEVWADDGRRLAAELDEATDPAAAISSWLAARAVRSRRPDRLVAAAIAGLDRSDVSIGRLADRLGLSERQLRRRVTAAVGYGPKRLARVLRLQRALDAGRAGEDLGRVALDAGYADQAHFANDCRVLAGVPPSVILRRVPPQEILHRVPPRRSSPGSRLGDPPQGPASVILRRVPPPEILHRVPPSLIPGRPPPPPDEDVRFLQDGRPDSWEDPPRDQR